MGNTYPGKFIVLDGPEGAGKSTQIERLVERLRELGHSATAVRDPGSTPVSERIREVLLDKRLPEMDVRTEVFLYMASRAEMVTRIIRPAPRGRPGGHQRPVRLVDGGVPGRGGRRRPGRYLGPRPRGLRAESSRT